MALDPDPAALGDESRAVVTTPRRARVLFVAASVVAVLAGGLVAAAGGEAPSHHLSWAAAYLVLVCGLAQAFLGAGQFALTPGPPSTRVLAWQFAAFNVGNAGVLAGTLSGFLPVLDAGSVVLLVSLGTFYWSTRKATARRRLAAVAYRTLVVLLAVSVPVGAVLAR